MHRIDGPGATVDNKFTEGDPVTAVPATVVTDDWLNDVQEELMSILTAGGVTPVKGTQNQVLAALRSGTLFQTPPQFDNDASAATTAFVARALGNMRGNPSPAIVASTTLLEADAGKWWTIQSAGAGAIVDLPAWTAAAAGSVFYFKAEADFTLRAAGAENILSPIAAGNTRAVKKGETVAVLHVSTGGWHVISAGFGADSFASVLGPNGYQKLPGGQILQVGKASTTAAGTAAITWPIQFPTACDDVLATASRIGVSALSVGPNASYTTTGATFYADTAMVVGFSYLAIGR